MWKHLHCTKYSCPSRAYGHADMSTCVGMYSIHAHMHLHFSAFSFKPRPNCCIVRDILLKNRIINIVSSLCYVLKMQMAEESQEQKNVSVQSTETRINQLFYWTKYVLLCYGLSEHLTNLLKKQNKTNKCQSTSLFYHHRKPNPVVQRTGHIWYDHRAISHSVESTQESIGESINSFLRVFIVLWKK